MSKNILILVSVVIGIGIIWLLVGTNSNDISSQSANNYLNTVSQQNDEQHIRILARSGYTPNKITAKSNQHTILEIETKGTYDCSSSISIPKLSYRNHLPATGVTNIEIPANMAQNSIEILCGMGMYRATINFES